MQESKIALVCKQTHFKAKFGRNREAQNNYLESVAISHRVGRKSKAANNGYAHSGLHRHPATRKEAFWRTGCSKRAEMASRGTGPLLRRKAGLT